MHGVDLGEFLFVRAVHVSAHAGHVTLQSGVQYHGHAAGCPQHHYWHAMGLDYEMSNVLGKSAGKERICFLVYNR